MTKSYRVFNPITGEYLHASTLEECEQLVVDTAYNFYMLHVHNTPYSVVEIQDAGKEVWRSADGSELTTKSKLKIRMSIPLTAVEVLP